MRFSKPGKFEENGSLGQGLEKFGNFMIMANGSPAKGKFRKNKCEVR